MAACRWCKQEMNAGGVSCTENTHVDFPDGEKLPAKPYTVEAPPAFGVFLDVDLNRCAQRDEYPVWWYADHEPKVGLVRVIGIRDPHMWAFWPWETQQEADARLEALRAEGYAAPGSGSDGLRSGVVVIEEPYCGDCATPIGGFHHPGCDKERCPRCDGQLISCGCLRPDEEEVDEDDTSEEEVHPEPTAANVVRLFKGDPVDLAALQEAPPPEDYVGFYDPPDSDVT